MSTNQTIPDDDLMTIITDYSYDLSTLSKRNGKLPAEAAVERLEARETALRTRIIMEALERLSKNRTAPDNDASRWAEGIYKGRCDMADEIRTAADNNERIGMNDKVITIWLMCIATLIVLFIMGGLIYAITKT